MPSAFDYTARARAELAARREVREASQVPTIGRRHTQARERLGAATERWHKAVEDAYPLGFWDAYDALGRRDPAGIEPAIAFLEADPWFFRSGYIKERLLRRLTRLDLTPKHAERLRHVVLAIVDSRDRREFRYYRRLARKLDSPVLRAALQGRLNSTDDGIRRRAQWVLEGLSG